MPTVLDFDTLKAISSIADSLDKIATELKKINKDGIKITISEIEGLKFYHDSVPIIDLTKP